MKKLHVILILYPLFCSAQIDYELEARKELSSLKTLFESTQSDFEKSKDSLETLIEGLSPSLKDYYPKVIGIKKKSDSIYQVSKVTWAFYAQKGVKKKTLNSIFKLPSDYVSGIDNADGKNIFELYDFRTTTAPSQFFLDFVGTANLQQNLSEANQETQGSAGLGVIFERYFLERDDNGKTLEAYNRNFFESLDMEAYINVASSLDTLKANVNITDMDTIVTNERTFGTYLLNPVNSQQSVFINSNIYFNPDLKWKRSQWLAYFLTNIISGANVRLNASNILWQLNDGTVNQNVFAGAISYRFGFFHEFLPNDKIRDRDNKRQYSVRLGLAWGGRHITGDLSSESNDGLRDTFLGTTDRDFSGWEPFFSFRLNNIIAEFTAPSIGGTNRDDIDGLTDTQFIFSVRFVGGFSLKINGKDNKNKEEENQ